MYHGYDPPWDKLGVAMDRDFIERRDGGFYVIGSRVPIDRLVWEYRNGEDPETIQSHYPTLNLEQVIGAIAFYLNHKIEVEEVIEKRTREEDAYICGASDTSGHQRKIRAHAAANAGAAKLMDGPDFLADADANYAIVKGCHGATSRHWIFFLPTKQGYKEFPTPKSCVRR